MPSVQAGEDATNNQRYATARFSHPTLIVSVEWNGSQQRIHLIQAAMYVADNESAVNQVYSLRQDLMQIPGFSVCTAPDISDNTANV